MMKTKLLCSVAAVALLGFATGTAQAFENVDWSWTKEKNQYVDIYHWQWSYFHPEGETEIEKMQIYVGNVTADAYLSGDYVPVDFQGGAATVSVDEDVEVSVNYVDNSIGENNGNALETVLFNGDDPGTAGDLSLTWDQNEFSVANEGADGVIFTFNVSGEFEVLFDDLEALTQTAAEGLGHAMQDASAVGVVDSIYSEVPVYAHETQALFNADPGEFDSVNSEGGLSSFIGEWLEPAEIQATAQAGDYWGEGDKVYYNPVEIAVDQNVSAVAEVLSIELAAYEAPSVIQTNNADEGDLIIDTGDTLDNTEVCEGDECTGPQALGVFYPINTNMILEADITQFAFANTTASAVTYQDLTNFTGLGSYDRLVDADGMGIPGLVSRQNVTAAGIVSTIENKIQVPDVQ